MSCAPTLSGVTRSILVTTPRTVVRASHLTDLFDDPAVAGPIGSSAGMHPITSTSRIGVAHKIIEALTEQHLRGRCRPAVSTMSWASSRLTMPRIVCRVVCGRFDVMAIFSPTSALVSVDLPVLGLPTKQMKPSGTPRRRLAAHQATTFDTTAPSDR